MVWRRLRSTDPRSANAVPGGGWDALHDLFDDVARDDEVRVLVLTGAGDDFCSGADVGGDRAEHQPHPLDSMRSVGRACQTLHTLPKRPSPESTASQPGLGSTWPWRVTSFWPAIEAGSVRSSPGEAQHRLRRIVHFASHRGHAASQGTGVVGRGDRRVSRL